MKDEETYWVALFDSVSLAMKAEKILKGAGISLQDHPGAQEHKRRLRGMRALPPGGQGGPGADPY